MASLVAHPRPDFMRDTFFPLDGEWSFAYDDADEGLAAHWYATEKEFDMRIQVPYCYQCKSSGIGDDTIHPVLWYRRTFELSEEMRERCVRICFGAVDWSCTVWVNGVFIGEHIGGYTPFSFDMGTALCSGLNDICLRVVDRMDTTQPRGKQYWKHGHTGCFYTASSGIWQSVYIEATGSQRITRAHVETDIDRCQAIVHLTLNCQPEEPITVSFALDSNVSDTPPIDRPIVQHNIVNSRSAVSSRNPPNSPGPVLVAGTSERDSGAHTHP
ncbi:hypothetical protein AGMMS49992_31240 [Clostridia bacterium]|nr:hypothetical protein AGMMS49992_31240 [Clostridia bacterium]